MSLEQSIEAAKKDTELAEAMSSGMMGHFLSMKQSEQEMLSQMSDDQRRVWLIERY